MEKHTASQVEYAEQDTAEAKHVEHSVGIDPYARLSVEDAAFMRSYEGKRGEVVVRKIDLRLIPSMALLYLISQIDRGNLANAKIEGMDTDLGLTGNQYNIASTIFFVPYIIFEIPSNMVLKKIRPSFWLSFLVISWGIVMTLMGIVKNFKGMIACRVFLGLCEAGFAPGAIYLVSTWYPRHELQQRTALFYTSSAFSGALSGLLAFGIARMDGLRGIRGWRWIFLVEGAITIAAGLVMPLLIVDTPEIASWLGDDEKRFIDLRLRLSGVRSETEEGDRFSWRLLFQAMTDWKVLLAIALDWSNTVPNAAFKFTLPQIIKQLGFTNEKAQLLTIPPYFCGGISAWVVGRYSDRFSWRFPFLVGPLIVLITGLAILFGFSPNASTSVGQMYFGVVLAQIGIYPLQPGITSWVGNNIVHSWKRSISLAWVLAAGNLGSLVGTNIFLDKESPRYTTGYGTSLAVICLGMVVTCTMELFLWRLNKAKAALSESDIRQKYTQEQLDKMGEKSPLYQYTL